MHGRVSRRTVVGAAGIIGVRQDPAAATAVASPHQALRRRPDGNSAPHRRRMKPALEHALASLFRRARACARVVLPARGGP
jgi:hypothetical protein